VPTTRPSAPSGPEKVVVGHGVAPDRASVAVKEKLTGRVYQPAWSGGRSGRAVVIRGGVSS
jgi:hypothetical protein